MKHIREVTSRFRLIWSLAALVVLLGALSVTPVRADPGCETGCWDWNQAKGCVNCQECCVTGGTYSCHQVNDPVCGILPD